MKRFCHQSRFAPTQKPVELIVKAIANSSQRGDLVLDSLGGSGSTLIGCERLGRRARLIELDAAYVDVTVRRWQDFTGREAVLEHSGCTFSGSLQSGRPIVVLSRYAERKFGRRNSDPVFSFSGNGTSKGRDQRPVPQPL